MTDDRIRSFSSLRTYVDELFETAVDEFVEGNLGGAEIVTLYLAFRDRLDDVLEVLRGVAWRSFNPSME